MSNSSAQAGSEDQPGVGTSTAAQPYIEFPLIALDRGRRGLYCTVQFCQSSLINTNKPATLKPCKRPEKNGTLVEPYNFNGTCGKRCVGELQYWQATLIATSLFPGEPLQKNVILAELGVATREALKTAENFLAPSTHPAIAVHLKLEQNDLLAQVLSQPYRNCKFTKCLAKADLENLEWTCGFLADSRAGSLTVIDVATAAVLADVRLPSAELYPFFNVLHPAGTIGAEIAIHLKAVEENLLSDDLRNLLWARREQTVDSLVGDLGVVVDTIDSDCSDDSTTDDDSVSVEDENNDDSYHDGNWHESDAGHM